METEVESGKGKATGRIELWLEKRIADFAFYGLTEKSAERHVKSSKWLTQILQHENE